MNKKFDGPSFVKPEHTSYNLNNGNTYQTPKMNFETKKEENGTSSKNVNQNPNKNTTNNVINKKGPKGGWEDDEEPEVKPKSNISSKKTGFDMISQKNNTNNNNNNYSGVRNENLNQNSNSAPNFKNGKEEPKSEAGNYVNYWDAENTKKIQSSTLSM